MVPAAIPFSLFAINKIWSSEKVPFPHAQCLSFRWGWISPAAQMGWSFQTRQSAYFISLRLIPGWAYDKARAMRLIMGLLLELLRKRYWLSAGLASLLLGGHLAFCGHNFLRGKPAQRMAESWDAGHRLPTALSEQLGPVGTIPTFCQ